MPTATVVTRDEGSRRWYVWAQRVLDTFYRQPEQVSFNVAFLDLSFVANKLPFWMYKAHHSNVWSWDSASAASTSCLALS